MSLRIRLRRVGRKKQPSYRIVVANSASPRDGAYVDELGFYNPRTRPAELRLDLEKVDSWVGKGATLSDTAASLVRKARKGGDAKVGYKVPGVVEEPAPATKPPAKRAPRKAAAAGSRGTPAAEPAAAAAAAAPVSAPVSAEAVEAVAPAEPAEPAAPAEEPAAE